MLDGQEDAIVYEGILFAENDWFYPIINGIPRLLTEAFLDYETFFRQHLSDYPVRKQKILNKYCGLINYAIKKNDHVKKSFTQEWKLHNYETDKTWDEDKAGMLQRFFKETDEDIESIKGKMIFDAGCGNGLLDSLIAERGSFVIAMDLSLSIEKAFELNTFSNVIFIQGDVHFPPVQFEIFDIIHCSGVLIHTNNTELSFSCLIPCLKPYGKLSVWLYHPRKDFIHNIFNLLRRFTSKLPLRLQYYLYKVTLFPISYVIKRLKGNQQNSREMMVDILDWFSPRYRWEHTHEEVTSWFQKRQFRSIKITTLNEFGFNIIGTKGYYKQ